jgi:hypothetical protein
MRNICSIIIGVVVVAIAAGVPHPMVLAALAGNAFHLNAYWACLFQLLAASGHQKLLRTAKRSAFQPASIKFVGAKTIQNQHKHIIG